jgi:hypothetical protein
VVFDHRLPALARGYVARERRKSMGIGVSLLLIAVGAILIWAVDVTVAGVDIDAVGVILLVVGALGVVLSMIFWSSWGGFGGRRDREVVVER